MIELHDEGGGKSGTYSWAHVRQLGIQHHLKRGIDFANLNKELASWRERIK